MFCNAMHLGRLAEQKPHRQINGLVIEPTVQHFQMLFFRGLPDHRKRTPLAVTDSREGFEMFRLYSQYVAFLRFVTPNFERAHSRFIAWHIAQRETTTAATIFDQFRQGITQATRTHVVNERNRIVLTQRPTSINDLLSPSLYFRVLSLN